MNDNSNHFDTHHLLMFSGKGGVGKTTLSCAFARHWAQKFPDEKILLLSTDPAHSLGDVLLIPVEDTPQTVSDLPNLKVRALDADRLLQVFRGEYGKVLELLVERGSFVQGGDLTPVWDLGWPGLDELMGVLEIQRILREQEADRVVVDMAPSGHTLNLFGLMDFLDNFLAALDLFQEKHRVISQSLSGKYCQDEADTFLLEMKDDLAAGRQLLQDQMRTACLVVGIPEPMSYLETRRFLNALAELKIPFGAIFINHVFNTAIEQESRRLEEQSELITKFVHLADIYPVFTVPQQDREPVGLTTLDRLFSQIELAQANALPITHQPLPITFPAKIPPNFTDFVNEGRRLILVGGKGGVGKTTVAAAIGWGMAEQHPDQKVRVISIDPAHSLGDALGTTLSHTAANLSDNLSGQEIDARKVLDQFREDYLWELAEMMSGDANDDTIKVAYGPEAWRQIVSQALPGIDEMLSLVTVMDLLEQGEQSLIVLDTAPTGHLLRFLEMPTALGDWLAWIFKLWIKYQDVVGRTDFMGRLRTLRQRVMQAQKKLKDPNHTEFIGVLQAQSAIIAEAERLAESIDKMGVSQRYVVQNRYQAEQTLSPGAFPHQTIVRLPELPRAIEPMQQIQAAAKLLF